MMITITVTRTKEWIAQQRLETGMNIPDKVNVPFNVSDFAKDVRAVLLEIGGGSYPAVLLEIGGGSYPATFSGRGAVDIEVDGETVTPEQVGNAILTASHLLAEIREERKRAEAERAAQLAASQAADEACKEKLAEARLLLAYELKEAAIFSAHRDTLADFLTEIPQDALRGTLKRLASGAAIEAMQKKIEDASPYPVFKDEIDE